MSEKFWISSKIYLRFKFTQKFLFVYWNVTGKRDKINFYNAVFASYLLRYFIIKGHVEFKTPSWMFFLVNR